MTPIPLHAGNPGPMTGDGNWTWLVPGRVPTLIDAGTGAGAHLEAVAEALGGAPLAQVLVTHAHRDHASGAPAVAGRFPGVRFRKLPWPDQDARWAVPWEALAPGDRVPAGDGELEVMHTPGHAPDHACFWHEPSRTLVSGDLAVKGTTVYIPHSQRGDLADYLASLERVLALAPARLLPAHGPVIEDPAQQLAAYLAHRRERDEQILAALRRGPASPDALVSLVYRGLRPDLRRLAGETVLAHLAKLEREGRVHHHGNAWHIMGP